MCAFENVNEIETVNVSIGSDTRMNELLCEGYELIGIYETSELDYVDYGMPYVAKNAVAVFVKRCSREESGE